MKKRILSILCILAFSLLLSSCADSATQMENKQNSLEDLGYLVVTDEAVVPLFIKTKTGVQPVSLLTATKAHEGNTETLYCLYFRSSDDATSAIKYVQTWAYGKMSDAVVKQSGKRLYFGTEQAIKDFE